MGVACKKIARMGLKWGVFRLVHLWNQTLEWANFLHVTYDIIGLYRNVEFF